MRRVPILFLLCCTVFQVCAMGNRLEDINAVKRDTAFLYAEATMPTEAEAAQVAIELLQAEIVRWSAEQQSPIDSLSAVGLSQCADTMVMRRADMFRVFTYMKKEYVFSGFPKAEPAEARDSTLLTDSVRQMILRRFALKNDHGVLRKIMGAKNFFELRKIMEPLKENGQITDYGKYATMQNPKDCYLIIYDPAGNICALLDKGEDQRKNLKTGKADTIKNYRGCGAIWFIIKE